VQKRVDTKRPCDMAKATHTISDLAKEFDITTRTIRFYEDQGLLHPERDGRNRIYLPRDRTRLKLVLRGKRLGFSLSDISEIIGLYDTETGEAGQLHYFIGKIEERRAMLKRQRKDIDLTLNDLQSIETQCRSRLKALPKTRKKSKSRKGN